MSENGEGENKRTGKIFVGGISWEASEQDLKDFFEPFGEIDDVTIMKDKMTGKGRGFAFVTFREPDVADKVVAGKHELNGRSMECKLAIPRDQQIKAWNKEVGIVEDDERVSKIFVGGLSEDVDTETFKTYFERFGKVVDCEIKMDMVTKKSRGFGFVTFESHTTVDEVLKKKDHEIKAKQIEIKKAFPRGADRSRMGRPDYGGRGSFAGSPGRGDPRGDYGRPPPRGGPPGWGNMPPPEVAIRQIYHMMMRGGGPMMMGAGGHGGGGGMPYERAPPPRPSADYRERNDRAPPPGRDSYRAPPAAGYAPYPPTQSGVPGIVPPSSAVAYDAYGQAAAAAGYGAAAQGQQQDWSKEWAEWARQQQMGDPYAQPAAHAQADPAAAYYQQAAADAYGYPAAAGGYGAAAAAGYDAYAAAASDPFTGRSQGGPDRGHAAAYAAADTRYAPYGR